MSCNSSKRGRIEVKNSVALSLIVQVWRKKIKMCRRRNLWKVGRLAVQRQPSRSWKIAKPRPRLCRNRQTKSTSLASTGWAAFLPFNRKFKTSGFLQSCSQFCQFLLLPHSPQRLGLCLAWLSLPLSQCSSEKGSVWDVVTFRISINDRLA